MTMCYRIIVIFGALALAGCANTPKTDEAQAEIDRQILGAAQKIQTAQADLYQAGALNQATTKLPIALPDDGAPVTVSWQGDALQLLNQLAHDRGQTFAFTGLRMPLPVNIDVQDAPLGSVLQLLRAQVGYRAQIVQYPDQLMLQYNRPQP